MAPKKQPKRRAGAHDKVIGANLKRMREAQGTTQTGLAKQVGVRFQQIQKYESGQNRIALVAALYLCKALGCDLYELVHGVTIVAV